MRWIIYATPRFGQKKGERERIDLRLKSTEQLRACCRLLRSEGYTSILPVKDDAEHMINRIEGFRRV